EESAFRRAVRTVLPKALEPWPSPKTKPLPDDSATKSHMARYMRGKFEVSADDKAQTIALTATATDPFEAKRLAETAMELFIQSELRFEAEGVERQRELDASFLKELTKSDEPAKKPERSQAST